MRPIYRLFIALQALVFSSLTFAAPKSDLWSYWQPAAVEPTVQVNHGPWQQFLDTYLIAKGDNTLVRYGAVTKQDTRALKSYLATMSAIDPHQLTRAQQYAYWVNLYNAYTVNLILDNYPTKSITKLGGFFNFGPWDNDITSINGKKITLNDIEHRILRPIWNDPRTHYAVNCASLGCPNLQPQAFTADNTEALLEQAEQEFVASDKGVKLTGDKLQLSSIYEWFAVDFGGKQGVLEHLSTQHPQLKEFSGKIDYDYDWSLNRAN